VPSAGIASHVDLVSPQPFWLLKNGLIRAYPSLKDDARCDVVVLGGGISGALVAEILACGGLDVIVIDKRDIGAGSTSASTALISYEIDTHLIDLRQRIGRPNAEQAYRACLESIDSIERLIVVSRIECDFQRKPSVYLAVKKSDASALEEECAARRAMGIAVEYVDEAVVTEMFSFSRPAALISEQAAQIDAHRLAHALLAKAVEHGARVYDRTTAEDIEPGEHSVRIKTESGHVVRAKHAVFATGYESQEFLPRRVINLNSTYALASEPVTAFPGWWERCLIWKTARPYLYLRTTEDGRVLAGGEDDSFRNPDRRDRLIEKKTDRLGKRFRKMFPAIDFSVDYRWAGTFGETKDGLAYIGSIRQMPRCLFALGFGGNGVTFSMLAAEIIRETLAGRTHPNAHLFRFDR
jgi:glycine/D-amino acid oxidase-like deaminating enzyme